MTIEHRGRGMRAEHRVVCNGCGGLTKWVRSREVDHAELVRSSLVTEADDGLRHACVACQGEGNPVTPEAGPTALVVAVPVPAPAPAPVPAPDAGPQEAAQEPGLVLAAPPPHPFAGQRVCLTGIFWQKRAAMAALLRALGAVITSTVCTADVLIVGDTTGMGGIAAQKMEDALAGIVRVVDGEAFERAQNAWNDGDHDEAVTIIEAEFEVTDKTDAPVDPGHPKLPAETKLLPPAQPMLPHVAEQERARLIAELEEAVAGCEALLEGEMTL